MPTKHTYLKTHRLSGDMLTFSLPVKEAGLRERAATTKAGRAAKTLAKELPLRLTLVALKKGVAMQPHQVDGALAVQVMRGRARINAAGADATLAAGGLVTIAPQQTHTVTALAATTLLITVGER